uniref:Ribonuclease H-like domain-containing protein n=1 Tax=Tanacetum cinerariifolium TaxID=118510 RepID=A0A6L2N9J5_TANCI|nr:ribonuclease H-like domain-containing protein [Tanacetum cinerariifolium]
MNDFCLQKGIKREFSNAKTPQQNGVAERRNKTLIEAARTMLVDAKLPVTFWAEAVNTACYVQNRVLVNKSQNKTPYELFNGRTPAIGFLKPFGCHVMILNTLDNLGMFEAKGDEGYFIGYLMSSKAFRVFNKRTRRVEEILHVEFLENKAIDKSAGPNWLFDIDSLTKSMNYVPVDAGTNSTNFSGTKDAANQEPHDESSTKIPEGSGNSNPTASSSNPPADQMETLTVESPIPTVTNVGRCLVSAAEEGSQLEGCLVGLPSNIWGVCLGCRGSSHRKGVFVLVLPRTRVNPSILNNFKEINMAANGKDDDGPPAEGGDLLVPDLRTMEELCQPTLNGRGGPISPIAIQATNFGLKNDMIQKVQNSCQFHGLLGDDANKHLDKFLHITQSIKVNRVTYDALCLYLFPLSLTHHATAWFDRFLRNSINTSEQMAKMFLEKYFPPC